MFHPALNWSVRSLVAIAVSLLWIGSTTASLQAQEKDAHPPADKAAKEAQPAVEAAGHADKAAGHADKPGEHTDKAGGHGDPAGANAAAAGNHEKAHGASPSPIDWSTDLALWSLIVFVLFVTILRVFAWGPLSSALDARERKIKSDIASAEEARVKAEKMLAEYQSKLAAAQDEVLKVMAEARNDAEHTRKEIMAQTEKEVSAMKERAILEIERTKDAALDELFGHMAGTVANATEKVLGRALTDADQDRLINDALAEFSRGQAS